MESFDVAVIGAGLAGLWCARTLAKRGLSVLLVDAKAGVDARVQTTGIFVRRTLEDFALPPAALGRPIRRVMLHSARGRTLELESRRDEFWVADMRSLYRGLLADCQRIGVAWSPLTRYRGLQRSGNTLIVYLGQRPVRARFIVGADGARSKVAADLELSQNRSFILGVEEVYEGAQPAASILHCVLNPEIAPGYIAWIVVDGTQAHIGTAGDPRRFRARRALEKFRTAAASLIDLRGAAFVERRAGLIPVNGLLPRIAADTGLLVGDAAGAPSPLTAGGLDSCVRLSEYAATMIADALSTNNPTPLQEYNGRRFVARFALRRWMRLALQSSPAAALEFACALMRAPIARAFAEHIFFGRGSFPEPTKARHRPGALPAR